MKRAIRTALLCFILLPAARAGATDLLWLSETAPPKPKAGAEGQAHTGHEHHMMQAAMPAQSAVAGGAPAAAASAVAAAPPKKHDHDNAISLDGEAPGKDHRPGKQVWLRQGGNLKNAAYVVPAGSGERMTMIDLEGNVTGIDAGTENGKLTLKTELPKVGFYATYLEQRAVSEGKLQVQLPKIELLWASCVAKEVDEEAVAKPIINVKLPLELVREHGPDEGCMARLVSGDVVKFMVLSFGQPVAGVPVTMITQEGWRNTVMSDASGHASFTLIREYYPKWFEFKKFHTDTFLATAELDREEAGELDGQRYTSAHYIATLPGKYRPSPYDYRSYAWGLGIALFVVVFGGLSVYLYRRRRLKPYREERVDDEA